jgi:hypothetical protein
MRGRSQRAERLALGVVGALAVLELFLACSDASTIVNPPVAGWNCSVTVTVNGETEEYFQLTPTSTTSTSDALLFGNGGVACELTATLSNATVTLQSGSSCKDPNIKSLTMMWSVTAGTITGSAKGKDDGGSVNETVAGSCVPTFGSP